MTGSSIGPQGCEHASQSSNRLSALKRVDERCDEFEAAWQAGTRPRIEEYLTGFERDERSELLSQLLRVELDYRRHTGERPTADEYRERFPDHTALVRSFFDETPTIPAAGETLAPAEPASTPDAQVPPTRVEGQSPVPAHDPNAPLPFGDFRLEHYLGGGGMGDVYLAVQKSLGKQVAVKLLKTPGEPSRELALRFLREARTVAQLRHPNIVQVHGIGRTDADGYFLVMDWVDGSDLAKRIKSESVPLAEAAEIVATVAEAVQYAHENGVIHRDLKPSNVLLDSSGKAMLTDFGLAKLLAGQHPELTHGHQTLGTPAYMAPEQASRKKWGEVGTWTDVYGLGGVLYALLARRPPFEGESYDEIRDQVISLNSPEVPRQLRPEVPEPLQRICMRCLSKQREARYSSAKEVAEVLRDWRAEYGKPARPAIFQTVTGSEWGQRYVFTEERIRIGRSPECELRIDDAAVSKLHAQVIREGRQHFIEDLGSRNGTFVNGQRLVDRIVLKDADQVQIATFTMLYFGWMELVEAVQAVTALLRQRAANAEEAWAATVMPAEDLRRIQTFSAGEKIDDFIVRKPFSMGGLGRTYLAEQFGTQRPVVLKILATDCSRLGVKTELVSKLQHPNIVTILKAGVIEGVAYLATELIDGMDVQNLLRAHGQLAVSKACEIARQAALGLQHLFEQGLVHRDIKPANLMVSPAGGVKIVDLGPGMLRDGASARGEILGTPAHLAPELARGERADIRSDLYGLGSTLYWLIAGIGPFHHVARSPAELLHAQFALQPQSIRDTCSHVPAELEKIIMRLLAKSPDDRFSTPIEFANAVEPFAAGANLAELVRKTKAVSG